MFSCRDAREKEAQREFQTLTFLSKPSANISATSPLYHCMSVLVHIISFSCLGGGGLVGGASEWEDRDVPLQLYQRGARRV